MMQSAYRIANWIFTGLVLPTTPGGSVPATCSAQLRQEFENAIALLGARGATLNDVVCAYFFVLNPWQIEDVLREAGTSFGGTLPAWTAVGCSGLPQPEALVGIRLIALADGMPCHRTTVPARNWLGEHARTSACRKGTHVFISGQFGCEESGQVMIPTQHQQQARIAYRHIASTLESLGGSLGDVLDFTSFHLDIRGADSTFREVYMPEVIPGATVDDAPTCSHIGVPALMRPQMLGCYSAIADLTPGRRTGSTPDAVWWKGTYPLAAGTRKPGGRFISLAGHVAAAQDGSTVSPGDAAGQLAFILDSMQETLGVYDLGLRSIADLTIYVKDVRVAGALQTLTLGRFPAGAPPALSVIGVSGLWLEGFELEVAALAIA